MQQALLAGRAANQFAVDVHKIRRDCTTRFAAPPSQPESSVNQSTDKPFSEVEDMASRDQALRRTLQNGLQLLTQPRLSHHLNLKKQWCCRNNGKTFDCIVFSLHLLRAVSSRSSGIRKQLHLRLTS